MKKTRRRSLSFALDVENDWPPVGIESLPFDVVPAGLALLVPPLFLKDLSVGDVITARERMGRVSSWRHKQRSRHSTVWLLRMKRGAAAAIQRALVDLHQLGCRSASAAVVGSYAIDVPPEASMRDVDAILSRLDENKVAIAYPSFRHPE